MQDITVLTRNPILTSPRVLRSDILLDKSLTDTKYRKTKIMPKKRQSRSSDYISNSSPETPSTSRTENETEPESFSASQNKTVVANLDSPMMAPSNIEKSFSCKMCDQSFVTKKGMKRHMRTHKRNNSQLSDETDSDNASSAPPQIIEISKLPKKRKREDINSSGPSESTTEDEQSTVRKKTKTINNNIIKDLKLVCPVCNKDDFPTANILDMHIHENHPDFQIKYHPCNLEFKNHQVLNLHKFMIHNQDAKTNTSKSVSGFNDCTFIDFSSSKFPEIAKTVCEQNVHKSVTDQKFRCNSCSRDFPCQSAMDIHTKTCDNSDVQSSSSNVELEEMDPQNDFLATLHLKTTESRNLTEDFLKSREIRSSKISQQFVDNTKDLADIQSILSVASAGGLLDQLSHKSRNQSKDDMDEVQDVFAAEFRKMKLRGEFPCRLCTAIFPNLRALKGHNRVHLNGNSTGPYRCNMCPHSSLDKAALVRHMRTHNGDRPYECAVCNYAFTTKANCERHLRNRHSKISRDDVKRSIIYHPSEDPNNDEINSKFNISRDEIKRTQLFSTPENGRTRDDMEIRTETSPSVNHFAKESGLTFSDHGLPISIPKDLSIVIPQARDALNSHCSIEPIISTSPSTADDITPPRIKVKGFGQLTQIPEFTESENEKDTYSDEEIDPVDDSYDNRANNYSSEIPMDLSTSDCQDDVLDLSKKRAEQDDKASVKSHVDDYIQKTPEFNNNDNANIFEKNSMLYAQHPLFKYRKIDANEIYAHNLSQLYGRAGSQIPTLGISPPFPYLLQHNPFLASSTPLQNMIDFGEFQKEIMRGLQMSGGGLVGMEQTNLLNTLAHAAKERFQAFHQHQTLNNISKDSNRHTPNSMVKSDNDVKPQHLHINIDAPTTIPYAPILSSPAVSSPKISKKDTASSHSPNSVKMVIKNGVLMPKQKQRRYRTERPFSCEHCSARFTLRSNMERHIKQQHPQYWSQRQRSSIGNLPRKNPLSLVPQNVSMPQNITINYDNRLNYNKNISNENSQDGERKDYSPGNSIQKNYMISDQVKYAILAQQLKSQNALANNIAKNRIDLIANGENEDEDEEDALVIDEETNDDKTNLAKQLKIDQDSSDGPNLIAKKVAQEILIGVTAKNRQDMSKDYEWKIAGSLISKNINSDIPTPVSKINCDKPSENTSAGDRKNFKSEEGDLVSVSKLLDNAATQNPFGKYFKNDFAKNSEMIKKEITPTPQGEGSEEDEEGLVASSGSASEGNNSGSDENKSESETAPKAPQKKKSAYSLAPNRVSCPYCHRKFPWSSSLRRHVLTHTGQKPYKCSHCSLLFTTKSNCDRHLLRKHGANSQPTLQNNSLITTPNSSNTIPIPELGNQGFMMRNVPERPYKCASCPSSTFSTLSNLKKHMNFKHGIHTIDSQPSSPKADGSQSRRNSYENEMQMTSDDERPSKQSTLDSHKVTIDSDSTPSKSSPSHVQDVSSNVSNSDLPFKCHLCEGSYAERQNALDHIKEAHESEYELLVCKGALETGVNFNEDLRPPTPGHRSEGGEDQGSEENPEHIKGKFLDYSNRKVVCAFCVRRFWSAEDLRRHMRTHTGERPFSCDVCRRRFTLKHSMLRHRKKHSTPDRCGEEPLTASGDEDTPSPISRSNNATSPDHNSYHPTTSTPVSSKTSHMKLLNAYQLAIHTKNMNSSPEIPNNVNNNNSPPAPSYEGKIKLQGRSISNRKYSTDDNAQENEAESSSDLIGNLLGISDRGMINKLLSSPDEAAKLLGVKK